MVKVNNLIKLNKLLFYSILFGKNFKLHQMEGSNERIANAALFILSVSLWYTHNLLHQIRQNGDSNGIEVLSLSPPQRQSIVIVYSTVTGTAKLFAEKLSELLTKQRDTNNFSMFDTFVSSISDFNEDNLENTPYVLFITSTCSDGTAPETAKYFMDWLKDMATDFRISKNYLKNVCFSGFGLGGLVYGSDNYCKPVSSTYLIM